MSELIDRLADPCHPGDVLRDAIEGRGETVAGAARKLGVSRAKLNRILAGRGAVTPATALALECTGWSAAETWLRMQALHDLARLPAESGHRRGAGRQGNAGRVVGMNLQRRRARDP